jgi:glyceraldehyde 3-phosphate dehydrogenase
MQENKRVRIGINGFGRIGRSFLRVVQGFPQLEVVAVNELATVENMAHLLKYDSTHGRFPADVSVEGETLIVAGSRIEVLHHTDIRSIDWEPYQVDFVLEATGLFKSRQDLAHHIGGSKRKVVVSAPAAEDIKTLVLGANDEVLNREDQIVSNASCTTNSVAPLLDIVDQLCGVEHAFITTVHSYTTDQRLQDGPHKDFRRGRGAAESIVPTTTGAAKAITRVFPKFEGKLGGAGIRVPVPDGSLTDITFTVRNTVSVEQLNAAFLKASQQGKYAPYLGYTTDPIVSRDVIGQPYSCLFDEELSVVLGKMVKVVGWYDNEIGYSNRLADLIIKMHAL